MKKAIKSSKPLLSQNIVKRRKLLGWDAHKLAEKARIPYPTLRDIEAGYSRGRKASIESISKALGCTEYDLYANENDSLGITEKSLETILNVIEARKVNRWTEIINALEKADQKKIDHVRMILGVLDTKSQPKGVRQKP